MKKSNKLITFIFNLLLLVFYTNTFVMAGVTVPEEVNETLTDITEILLLVGTAVCVGKVIHIGILYVTSSAAEKSNAKQSILPWIIGTVICFGAATVGGAIIKLFEGVPTDVLKY